MLQGDEGLGKVARHRSMISVHRGVGTNPFGYPAATFI